MLGNIGKPTIDAIKARPKATALKARIPERDLSGMRDMVLQKAAAKRGTNAQTTSYGKAMNSAFKNTKTFGIPGK